MEHDYHHTPGVICNGRDKHCERCGEHIQDENLWDVDGALYCPKCAREEFERDTDNYTED